MSNQKKIYISEEDRCIIDARIKCSRLKEVLDDIDESSTYSYVYNEVAEILSKHFNNEVIDDMTVNMIDEIFFEEI